MEEAEIIISAIFKVAIISILIERALSVLFESRLFIDKTNEKIETNVDKRADGVLEVTETIVPPKGRGMKEGIALAVSIGVACYYQLDIIKDIYGSPNHYKWIGYVITGGIIAGGTKGSVKLFRDVFNIMSTAQREKMKLKKQIGNN
ncbi:MAG: hypothetical protein L3J29_04775 [Cyclobacteriaceae bacterium]|nr:hypothetical protein [Cyclobacteriaceae bacterium]